MLRAAGSAQEHSGITEGAPGSALGSLQTLAFSGILIPASFSHSCEWGCAAGTLGVLTQPLSEAEPALRSSLGRLGLISSPNKGCFVRARRVLVAQVPSGSAAPSQGRGFPRLPPWERESKSPSLGDHSAAFQLCRKNQQPQQLPVPSSPKNGGLGAVP